MSLLWTSVEFIQLHKTSIFDKLWLNRRKFISSYNISFSNIVRRHFYYIERGTLIKVNTGSAPQFELIRSASSFWHLFCGFWANIILPWSSTSQLDKNTLHLWPSHWVSGSTLWLHHTLMLPTQICASHSPSLPLSLCKYLLSQCESPATSLFVFSFDLVCCVCSSLIIELSTWTDEERLIKPTWHLSKLLPLTYVAFSLFLTMSDSFSFSASSLQWVRVCCHFPSHPLFSSPEGIGLSNSLIFVTACSPIHSSMLRTLGLKGPLVSISDSRSVRESSCWSKLVCFSISLW